ncbi:von Willebrand factor A domain-containing protein 1-like [Haliotis rubra]|uniref:von Willebrand factor A domain-containing protein 1-like n=1 Tax=Haliotis rubra TaxID=36100 RepID=UPI001EE5A0C7|nr:von Willebrand factor A domain-containing protein 1-like [Haliotis rubra]
MFALFLSLLLVVPGCLSVNVVEHAGATGPDVVTTVVDIIRTNCIFPQDKLFLRRLAYVETRDGSSPKTYSDPNNSGGIWQVSSSMLAQTQGNQPELQPLYTIIQNALNINWRTVQWSDLRKPLYSGLAAALYLTLQTSHPGVTIPLKVEEQAVFWKDKYQSGGSSAYNFTAIVNEMELGCQALNRQVDIAFIVDTSSSLSKDDFTRVKNFLKEIVNGLNIGASTAHVAVITYASNVNVQFRLNKYFSNIEVYTAISNLVYTGGATNTAGALNAAVTDVFARSMGGRDSAVKVAILITDGVPDDAINTEHAADNVRLNGIAVFTVGVGSAIDTAELRRVATPPSCTHSYIANGYDSIANLKQEIQNNICRAPLYANATVECTIGTCPPYAFPFTGNNGLTIQSTVSCGSAVLYADVNNFYPGPAHNLITQVIDRNGNIFYQAKPDANTDYLYIMAKDSQRSIGCNLTLTPLIGNKVVTGFEVICRDLPSHSPRPCTKSDLIQFRPLICDSVPTVQNPCKPADAVSGKKYPLSR